MRALKQQNNALADEAASAKFKLVDAQQEQLKLKGQIVEVCRLCLLPLMVACPPTSNWISSAGVGVWVVLWTTERLLFVRPALEVKAPECRVLG